MVIWFFAFIGILTLLTLGVRFGGKKIITFLAQPASFRAAARLASPSNSTMQAEAEQLLQRAAGGDVSASDQILARSEKWIGKTQRTPKANQLITVILNSHDLHARESGIQADLALDGVSSNESGLNTLERSVENPDQRVWALWTLGALGNRGVDPAHTASMIASYVTDTDVNVRSSAVNGLALLGSDATIPILLDRFRNDASPVVQEQAACGLAESGMYTHQQRMVAAASIVNWLDDPIMTAQQRAWALQALRDISGKNFGTESAAWRQWYDNAR